MMMSPESFVEELKDKEYKALLKEREKLLKSILRFEKGKIPEEEYFISPNPEVIYQCELLYLGKLCELISKKYNEEYVC